MSRVNAPGLEPGGWLSWVQRGFSVGRPGHQDVQSRPACPQACSSASPLLCMAESGLFRLCFPGCLVSRLLARCCLGDSLAGDWRVGWGGKKYRIFSSPAWMPSLAAAEFLSWPRVTHCGPVFFWWPWYLALRACLLSVYLQPQAVVTSCYCHLRVASLSLGWLFNFSHHLSNQFLALNSSCVISSEFAFCFSNTETNVHWVLWRINRFLISSVLVFRPRQIHTTLISIEKKLGFYKAA